jgi:hypothetical protein
MLKLLIHLIMHDLYCRKHELNVLKTVTFCVIFQFPTMFDTMGGAGAVGAASCYGSGQMMRLRLRNTAFN